MIYVCIKLMLNQFTACFEQYVLWTVIITVNLAFLASRSFYYRNAKLTFMMSLRATIVLSLMKGTQAAREARPEAEAESMKGRMSAEHMHEQSGSCQINTQF